MKRSKLALSAILVPAVALYAGGGGTTTCTAGGGPTTPPALTLPAQVTGVQANDSMLGATHTMTLSGIDAAGGFSITNSIYAAWCTNPGGYTPSDLIDPQTKAQLFESATYLPKNSYLTSTFTAGPDTGYPGQTLSGRSLTLAQEWSAVNWIINNQKGSTGNLATSIVDIQGAIWQLLHPTDGVSYVTGPQTTPASLALYNDAIANGLTFIPSNGQFVAVILVPVTPSDSPQQFQGVLIPVPVTTGGCTGTSKVTLTKTASVATASAYQTVTYTYVVRNAGTNQLTNVVVTDDNGTPAYLGDDYTVGTIATLNAGASATLTAVVYLPITYTFTDSKGNVYVDTMITQAGSSNTLKFTYLEDVDVTDNTYGTSASADWTLAGGHSFAQLLQDKAAFQLVDSRGTVVNDFTISYLTTKSGAAYPSGYGAGLFANTSGNSAYLTGIASTLADNLNGFSKFYTATVNSPVNDADWKTVAGYEVTVNKGAFGFFGFGSANVKSVALGMSKYGYAQTYTPKVMEDTVTSTAYVKAYVPCCKLYVNAQASVSVCINGLSQSCVPQIYKHKCGTTHQCNCTCSSCKSGSHSKCSLSGCYDAKCKASGCKQQCQCTCSKCSAGDHDHCVNTKCTDSHCHTVTVCPVSTCKDTCFYCKLGWHSLCSTKGCKDSVCHLQGCTR